MKVSFVFFGHYLEEFISTGMVSQEQRFLNYMKTYSETLGTSGAKSWGAGNSVFSE
jgi:hypothetical protein